MSETPIVDAYPTSIIEREIHFALNPVGMSVHSGKVTLACDHVQHLLSRARDIELKLAAERKRADEVETPVEELASKLIDAWCADKGAQIPWAKAVQIVAIVTKQSDAERDLLLKMGDEDGACGMCGRIPVELERQRDELRAENEELRNALRVAQYKNRNTSEGVESTVKDRK